MMSKFYKNYDKSFEGNTFPMELSCAVYRNLKLLPRRLQYFEERKYFSSCLPSIPSRLGNDLSCWHIINSGNFTIPCKEDQKRREIDWNFKVEFEAGSKQWNFIHTLVPSAR